MDTGRERSALQLLGAADALRVALSAPRAPAPELLLADALAPARESLRDHAQAAIDDGASMTLAEVAELVRRVCRN
jgi:hypothetical protein